jgi:hypothetical protein
VIGWVLAGILVFDVLTIPLLVFGHGAPMVGTVRVANLFGGQSAHGLLPTLSLGDVSVYASEPSRAQDLLYSLGNGLPVMLVLIPLLISAIRLTENARHNDPFTPQMVRRLRRLGRWVLALGLLSSVVEYVAQTVLLDISLPHDDTLRFGTMISHYPTLTPWWLVPGLVLLAVSEIVRRGCDLRAELDEVI